MTGRLNQKVVIVTGAAGGIGRALVRVMLGHGATVAALDVDEAALESLAADHHADAARLMIRRTDISDYTECAGAVEATLNQLGPVDGLINNAAMGMGVIRDDHMSNLVAIEELDGDTWSRMVGVNLSGPWNMTRHTVPGMRQRGFGRIINVTTSFFTMLRGGFHPYGPSKAGLEAMSAGHAAEFSGTGITVNVVVPGGPTDTPMVPQVAPYAREDLIPPEAMAPPMVWLCSDAPAEISGQRFVAAEWNSALSDSDAAKACGAPIAWPELAANPVWPGGRPRE